MLNNDKSEQIEMLTKRINDLVDEAEVLGCEGRVEEAQGVMKLCEQLKEERTQLEEVSFAFVYVFRTSLKCKDKGLFNELSLEEFVHLTNTFNCNFKEW